MRASIVPMALAVALAVPAFAQAPGSRMSRVLGNRNPPAAPAPPPESPAPTDPAVAKASTPDRRVVPEGTALPEPVRAQDIKAPTITLPDGPIEPYLLTKDDGPFMVMAQTFRGPDATKYAMALVLELRNEYHLPAWIFYQKSQPLHSLIRNIPPTAFDYVKKPEMQLPEKVRVYDEAAVLVGNCKSEQESLNLLHKVKKIHPKCLDAMPNMWDYRRGQGLHRALRTTNPLVPVQYLYPAKADPLIKQMNAGPMSVFHCPGRFTLQVAEFTGRSSLNGDDKAFSSITSLMHSPLQTAADDAQKLADILAKDPELVRAGYQPYVYHDRTSSKVMLGAFESPKDARAVALRQMLLTNGELQGRIVKKKEGFILVPADGLLDLQSLPPH